MAATTYDRISMTDVDIIVRKVASGATALLTVTNFEASQGGDENDGDAGSVDHKQWSTGRGQWTGGFDFQLGGEEVPDDAPKRGDVLEIAAVATIIDGVDLLPDLMDESANGKIGVTGCRYTFPNTGNATGRCDFKTGYLPRPSV